MLTLDRDKCMTLNQLVSLISYINKFHSYSNAVGRRVKHVLPHIDTKTGYVYKVELVMKGNTEDFTTLGKTNTVTLNDAVMDWLESK